MLYRLILADWAADARPDLKKVLEGDFDDVQLRKHNADGYNVYFLPNSVGPNYTGTTSSGTDITDFRFVFVDMDLKDGHYPSKEAFQERLDQEPITPSFVVDSGNGVHAYYAISDLDAMSFLRFQRRLCRLFNTDEMVSKIHQLMRVPNTINTKHQDAQKKCILLQTSDKSYTCEEMDKLIPIITMADETYCVDHYNRTYSINQPDVKVDEKLPVKFSQLLASNKEVKSIWMGGLDDRSGGDYRLAHIMLAANFTKAEARSVLVNCAKALSRSPVHRVGYAEGIVSKVWAFEQDIVDAPFTDLSYSVRDILSKSPDTLRGTRFPCYTYFDDTEYGFRLGQIIGLVAGSGVGKTAVALNMFMGFVTSNPNYTHLFIPLEQPANEIADRWRTMCGNNTTLHDKVHVMSNYGPNGEFRHLSFKEIKDYILKFQTHTGQKVGCVVIDHIGALKKKGAKAGEGQDLIDICHEMTAFAVETTTLLVMQSQAPREKAGIGDLGKDAAYGTVFFESYCDYLITLWQPLKRCYKEGAPTVTAFKFCKIRHKKQGVDKILEDVCYKMLFDPIAERLRNLTENEEKSFTFYLSKSTNIRKQDRKTDLVEYVSAKEQGVTNV